MGTCGHERINLSVKLAFTCLGIEFQKKLRAASVGKGNPKVNNQPQGQQGKLASVKYS